MQARLPKLAPPRARLSDEEARGGSAGKEGLVASRAAVPSSDSEDDMAVKFKSGPVNLRRMDATGGSDSEGESGAVRGLRQAEMLKWKDPYEEKLEALLVEWEFDFEQVARDFRAFLRKEEPGKRYEINARTLQLKWTDIEIKVGRRQSHLTQKYRMKEIRGKELEDEEEEEDPAQPSEPLEYTNLEELD